MSALGPRFPRFAGGELVPRMKHHRDPATFEGDMYVIMYVLLPRVVVGCCFYNFLSYIFGQRKLRVRRIPFPQQKFPHQLN